MVNTLISNRTYPPYLQRFNIGDIVIAKQTTRFVDGTIEKAGEKILITEGNESFYNVWWHIYEKVI